MAVVSQKCIKSMSPAAVPNGNHQKLVNAPELRKMEVALELYKNPTTITTYRCHYTGCESDSKYDIGVVMFTVPRTGCRRIMWLEAMGLDETDSRKNLKCCSKHFDAHDSNKRGKLLKTATPKLYEVPSKPPDTPVLPSGNTSSSSQNNTAVDRKPRTRKQKAIETEPSEISPKKRRQKMHDADNKENSRANKQSGGPEKVTQLGLVMEIPRTPMKGISVNTINCEVTKQGEETECDDVQAEMSLGPCHEMVGSEVESSLNSKKDKKYEHALRGLCNLGNSCYMNATLQALFSSPLFEAYVSSHEHVDGVSHISTGCMSCHLRFVLHNIRKNLDDPFSPSVFARFIWSFHCFSRGEQDCAMKLLQFVLDGIREEEGLENFSGFKDMSTGIVAHLKTCCHCETQKAPKEETLLDLNLKMHRTLSESIDDFLQKETMEGGNSPWCYSCLRNTIHTTQTFLLSCPQILILQLNRFQQNPRTLQWEKNDGEIIIDRHLRLPITRFEIFENGHSGDEVVPKTNEFANYHLVSTINHCGSLQDGHYTSHKFDSNFGRRISFNDAEVVHDSTAEVDGSAYVLIYEKQSSVKDFSKNDEAAAVQSEVHQIPPSSPPESSIVAGDHQQDADSVKAVFHFKATGSKKKPIRENILKKISKTKVTQLDKDSAFFYTQLKKQRREIVRKSKKIAELKLALRNEETVAKNFLGKNLPENCVDFIFQQISLRKKEPKGRRYRLEEKLLTIDVAKGGRRGLRALKKMFALPSMITTARLLRDIPIDTGYNARLFVAIEDYASTLTDVTAKAVSLLVDEIAIMKHLSFNSKKKRFDGVADFGEFERIPEVANEAQVTMIYFLKSRVKMLLSYVFASGTTPADLSAKILLGNIKRLANIGVRTVSVVCDQAPSNRQMYKKLEATTEKPYITLNGLKTVLTYDAPHIFKRIVAMLRKYFVRMAEGKIADIDHVRRILEVNQNLSGTRLAPKLTYRHIFTDNKTAMRVHLATQVISQSVAAAINTLISSGHLPSTACHTSSFCQLMNDTFDSLNGSTYFNSRPLKERLDDNSPHWEHWRVVEKEVSQWSFVHKITKKSVWSPSFISLRWDFQAMRELWPVCKSLGFKYLLLRDLDQDPIENGFRDFRDQCGDNRMPTTSQFRNAFVNIQLNAFNKAADLKGNCEPDEGTMEPVRKFLVKALVPAIRPKTSTPSMTDVAQSLTYSDIGVTHRDLQNIEANSDSYFAGFCIKYVQRRLNCNICVASLCVADGLLEPHHVYTQFKEYDDERLRLKYASERFADLVGQIVRTVKAEVKVKFHLKGIDDMVMQQLSSKFNHLDWIGCAEHHELCQAILFKFLITTCCHWFAKDKNRQMKLCMLKSERKRKLMINTLNMKVKRAVHTLRKKARKCLANKIVGVGF
ncbi:uncharacterized protein LOC132204616 [Neocloeon triangulifer]|uniref:uncharacterized protein LOC132204616 n=1 Tax=Neocloeon triangulifer TaxID=2078957 RepID=UPI00286F99B6|nr:uncharacterized protein LOC132204616 [Neocloeon triangulifer]